MPVHRDEHVRVLDEHSRGVDGVSWYHRRTTLDGRVLDHFDLLSSSDDHTVRLWRDAIVIDRGEQFLDPVMVSVQAAVSVE